MSSEEKPAVADEVLAYGLAWQENRDLHLALPGPMVATTLTRLPWIETKVRVWVMEGVRPQQVRTLSRMDVLDRLRELPPRVSRRATLPADAEPWIAALETSGLEAHNRSYRSWHHPGSPSSEGESNTWGPTCAGRRAVLEPRSGTGAV